MSLLPPVLNQKWKAAAIVFYVLLCASVTFLLTAHTSTKITNLIAVGSKRFIIRYLRYSIIILSQIGLYMIIALGIMRIYIFCDAGPMLEHFV